WQTPSGEAYAGPQVRNAAAGISHADRSPARSAGLRAAGGTPWVLIGSWADAGARNPGAAGPVRDRDRDGGTVQVPPAVTTACRKKNGLIGGGQGGRCA